MKRVLTTVVLGSALTLTGSAFAKSKKEAKPAQTEENCPVIASVKAKNSVAKGHKDYAKFLKFVNAGNAEYKCFPTADEATKAGFPAAN